MKGLALGACPSKYLDKRWKKMEKDIHKKKLRCIKSTIREQYQSQPFGTASNAGRNGKKEALMECKFTSPYSY